MTQAKSARIFKYLLAEDVDLTQAILITLKLKGITPAKIANQCDVGRSFVSMVIAGDRKSESIQSRITMLLGFNPWGKNKIS